MNQSTITCMTRGKFVLLHFDKSFIFYHSEKQMRVKLEYDNYMYNLEEKQKFEWRKKREKGIWECTVTACFKYDSIYTLANYNVWTERKLLRLNHLISNNHDIHLSQKKACLRHFSTIWTLPLTTDLIAVT